MASFDALMLGSDCPLLLNNSSVDLEGLDDLLGGFFAEPSCSAAPLTGDNGFNIEACFADIVKAATPTCSSGACSSADVFAGAEVLSSSGVPARHQQTTMPCELRVQRSAGPPTRHARRRGPVRLVTTGVASMELDQPSATPSAAPVSSAPAAPVMVAAAPAAVPKPASVVSFAALLHGKEDHMSEDEDSDDSNDTEEGAVGQDGKKANKRKAPEIDWRSITDPAERRRQRRLAKNRMTAARSRERKKVQWSDMEARLNGLDGENKRLRAMLEELARENAALRGQLEGLVGSGDAASGRPKGHSTSNEPAALVFIGILLLLCCALPGDQAMLLGSAAPLLLLAAHALAPRRGRAGGLPTGDSLLRFLLSLKVLTARAGARLKASLHRMLFQRHRYGGGRRTLRDTAAWWDAAAPRFLAATAAGGDAGDGAFKYEGAAADAFIGDCCGSTQESLLLPLMSRVKAEPLDDWGGLDCDRFLAGLCM